MKAFHIATWTGLLSSLILLLAGSIYRTIPAGGVLWSLLIATLVCSGFCLSAIVWMEQNHPDPKRVDIWRYQRLLMDISAQGLPNKPVLNKDALLYLALILEEVAETAVGVHRGLLREEVSAPGDAWGVMRRRELILDIGRKVETMSGDLRSLLKRSPSFEIPLPVDVAVEILDGITDTAVVVAGFGLAAGLPVRAGYEEVQESNLSKANPNTGLIDKDASGKWIKGIDYAPPNLGRVVMAYVAPPTT